ncbi:serine/threonine protein kinase PknB [Nocardioidaceae bacterium Broad-1]|nr:serine/threonine protein kinase PknB [Nocardioidaceae bacterium Broad-1]
MGAVWLATDDVLGRSVALKQLVALDGVSDAAVEREARLAARLVHPNVVAVFDLVRDDDKPWLVMEYVEGKTLAHMVRDDGPLSVEDAARLIGQIASALRAAHAAGIGHLDVKPPHYPCPAVPTLPKLTRFRYRPVGVRLQRATRTRARSTRCARRTLCFGRSAYRAGWHTSRTSENLDP